MNRIVSRQVPTEMASLWAVETSICFLVLYAVISSSIYFVDSQPLERLDDSALLALTMGVTAFAGGLYQPYACFTLRKLLLQVTVTAILSVLMVWLISRGMRIDVVSLFRSSLRWPLAVVLAWIGLVLVTRLVLNWAIRMDLFVRRVVIVADAEPAARINAAISTRQHAFLRVFKTLPVEHIDQLSLAFLRREKIRIVIFGRDACASISANDVLQYQAARIKVWRSVEFWEAQFGRIDIEREPDHDVFPLGTRANQARAAALISRLFDVLLSIMLLIATLPVTLAVAALIKLESPGPILYWQERMGLHGRIFTLCKFRSMNMNAEPRGPIWAAQRDRRVTRIGSFIRRTHIDELPQLLNVLRGEMSFIGPRPERPYFVEQIDRVVPGYGKRALVKPGITGWAQVNFPYGASIDDARVKLSYDLYYVKHRSLLLDFLILFSTVRVILFQEGAR